METKLKERYGIAQLLAKEVTGTLSEKEAAELEAWLKASPDHSKEFDRMKKRLQEDLRKGKELDHQKEWQAFRQKHFRKRNLQRWWYGGVAAAVAAGLLFAALLQKPEEVVPMATNTESVTKTHKARLILNDGSTVTIADTSATNIAVSQHAKATISGNGLKYENSPINLEEDNIPMEHNTIIVPRGGEYELELSDGTRVWLNSESKLEFPVRFSGDLREVRMEGEVCFQVAKNEHKPFIVRAGDVTVEVLGTLFNIEAYPETKQVKTTLAEGSVKISNGKRQQLLAPDEQAISEKGQIRVEGVDASNVVSWIHGICYFSEASLEEIMDKLARWYNVEVFFADESAKRAHFSLEIERYDDIASILSKIELTGRVRFEINGRTVVIRE